MNPADFGVQLFSSLAVLFKTCEGSRHKVALEDIPALRAVRDSIMEDYTAVINFKKDEGDLQYRVRRLSITLIRDVEIIREE